MFFDEFAPLYRRISGNPEPREALLGFSMGGYGALLAAEKAPTRFRAVAVTSPALWPHYASQHAAVPDAFDSERDFAANDVVAGAKLLRATPIRISCATHDPFLPGVEAIHDKLPQAIVAVSPGCHDDAFFRRSASAQLAFIGAHAERRVASLA